MKEKLLSVFSTNEYTAPPIWFMRQAGRYISEYRDIRMSKSKFLDICYNPELATRVAFLPIKKFGFDGIILFSDILVVLDAINVENFLNTGSGKKLTKNYANTILLNRENFIFNALKFLQPVFEIIKNITKEKSNDKTVIGFAGCPFTVLCYAFLDQDKVNCKKFESILEFIFNNEVVFEKLVDFFVELITNFLLKQIESGAEVVQLFESHCNFLSFDLFKKYVAIPVEKISKNIKDAFPLVKVIAFTKGAGTNYREICSIDSIDCVSFDCYVSTKDIKSFVKNKNIVIQGNLDPHLLCYDLEKALSQTVFLLNEFKGFRYIFNLGHGILPNTPEKNVERVVDVVKNFDMNAY